MSLLTAPHQESATVTRSRRASTAAKFCAPCAANASAAQAAIAAFSALNAACASAAAAVGAANFGPFSNSGSCDYDCGFMEQDWSWGPYNYTAWAGQNFNSGLALMNASGGYEAAFAAISQWLGGLPSCTASLTAALGFILQTDAVIVQAGGVVTPAQQQALNQAFATALAQVQNSLAGINAAVQTMSTFINQAMPNNGYLQSLSTSLQTTADNQMTNGMNNLIGQLSCGGGTVTDQFNAMKTTVDNSFTGLQPSFNTVNSNFTAALAAAQEVVGVLINLQTDSSTVTDAINKAQGYPPTSAMRTININIATDEWNNTLVVYANAQLGI